MVNTCAPLPNKNKSPLCFAFKIAFKILQGMLLLRLLRETSPCASFAMATTSTRKKALVGPCMRSTSTPSSAHSKGHARDSQDFKSSLQGCEAELACEEFKSIQGSKTKKSLLAFKIFDLLRFACPMLLLLKSFKARDTRSRSQNEPSSSLLKSCY